MVVQYVHHPHLTLVSQEQPSGIDLPQVVGRRPFKALGGGPGPGTAEGHQVVAHQGSVDGRDRRRIDALAPELGPDAPGPPLGMVLSHPTDLLFDLGRHPLGLVQRLA
jgi:hypothetical protein